MRNVLSLDVDGVLTTSASRQASGVLAFDARAVEAVERLIREAPVHLVVIHSSWRKLPSDDPSWNDDTRAAMLRRWRFLWSFDAWRAHCRAQGAHALAAIQTTAAPFKVSSTRIHEIQMWRQEHAQHGDRIVVLDDQIYRYDMPAVCVVTCDDAVGFTAAQCDTALEYYRRGGM